MSFVRLSAAALAALSIAACAGTPETGEGPQATAGTRVGAGAGGLIGSQVGGGTGERIAAGRAGAALGGLIGNRIGAGMDDDDKRRAYAAQMQALEAGKSGVGVAWKNPDSGRYGSVVPGPAYQSNGLPCRPYTHTIYINGQPQGARAVGATSAAALPRQRPRFVIADYARACGGTWLRQIYEVPLPHVAASTVVRRCRGTARRDVTALGVPRSATVLFSPRRQGNVNSIRWIDMTLWFGLALMTAAAIWAVLWPLARRASRLRSGSDVAIYRDQLEEIERDRAAGLIEDNEAASAQVEVSRRLIAAADAQTASPTNVPSATWRRRAVAIVALVLLPLGATTLYLALGSPLLPDRPLAPRLAAVRADQSIDTLIAKVETHLESNPDDGRGWEVIAPIYIRLGRFDDAVRARRNALRLNGSSAEREAGVGEALVFAANAIVTAQAKAAFQRAG